MTHWLRRCLRYLRGSLLGLTSIPHAFLVLTGSPPGRSGIRVYYGRPVPDARRRVHGGVVKLQPMQRRFPNTASGFNILYLVSSVPNPGARLMVSAAKRRGARFVWNQNGVAYPAWDGVAYKARNAPMARLLHAADYVLYQSEFCRRSADRFLGQRRGRATVLHNAVDTTLFAPRPMAGTISRPVLLAAGTQSQPYRMRVALETLAAVRRSLPRARLIVAGRLGWAFPAHRAQRLALQMAADLGVADHVSLLGAYSPAEAPELFRSADVLVHTQFNDACPSVVLEAMACGLPIAYQSSGGTPELVGDDAGIGVPAEETWLREIPPDPEALARCTLEIVENLSRFSEAARQRAVECFDLSRWLARHHQIFEEVLL